MDGRVEGIVYGRVDVCAKIGGFGVAWQDSSVRDVIRTCQAVSMATNQAPWDCTVHLWLWNNVWVMCHIRHVCHVRRVGHIATPKLLHSIRHVIVSHLVVSLESHAGVLIDELFLASRQQLVQRGEIQNLLPRDTTVGIVRTQFSVVGHSWQNLGSQDSVSHLVQPGAGYRYLQLSDKVLEGYLEFRILESF